MGEKKRKTTFVPKVVLKTSNLKMQRCQISLHIERNVFGASYPKVNHCDCWCDVIDVRILFLFSFFNNSILFLIFIFCTKKKNQLIIILKSEMEYDSKVYFSSISITSNNTCTARSNVHEILWFRNWFVLLMPSSFKQFHSTHSFFNFWIYLHGLTNYRGIWSIASAFSFILLYSLLNWLWN